MLLQVLLIMHAWIIVNVSAILTRLLTLKSMRIGLIADTHMPGSMEILWPQAMDLFGDVQAILHAGDLHTLDIVDQLCELAPTYVARGNGDVGIIDDRLKDTWVLEFSGITIGMIHRLPSPERKTPEQLSRYLARHFDIDDRSLPELIVFGHTHREGLHQVGDRLYVNPGSPTLPRNQSLRLGTLGLLEISDNEIQADILQLTESGSVCHSEIAGVTLARP